ncbi:MAG: glycoside hydrolase, partial [Bacteroidota bacterium]|nr:glycoside hydrolase [Bacteroidota bacterium]
MKKNLLRLCLLIWCSIAGDLVTAQPVSHSNVPGVVIDHSSASSGQYIGSPSICILPNGNYVASHDFFGPKSSEHVRAITWVFTSFDKGKTWKKISAINGQFWSTLFELNNALYIIGTFHEYGNLVIRKSLDNGVTWTNADNSQNGLLREGRYHTAPT